MGDKSFSTKQYYKKYYHTKTKREKIDRCLYKEDEIRRQALSESDKEWYDWNYYSNKDINKIPHRFQINSDIYHGICFFETPNTHWYTKHKMRMRKKGSVKARRDINTDIKEM